MGNCLSCFKRHSDASRAQVPENLPVRVPDPSALTQSSQPSHTAQLAEITDATQFTLFIAYIETLLSEVKKRSHSALILQSSHSAQQQQSTSTGTSTSEIVKSHIKFAADTMDKISSEGEKLHQDMGNLVSRFPEEAKRVVTDAMKGLGNIHWIAIGFSVIAFVLETMQKVSSNVDKALKLLDKIIDLAKILQKLYETMPTETEKLNKAVHTIVEGAIICCSYIEERKIFRYLSATTTEESLKETWTNLSELRQELGLIVGIDNQKQIPRRKEQLQTEILQIQPVGIDREATKVMELLDMENRGGAARAVIIYGFGGIGKTTLAEYVVSMIQLKNNLKLSVVRMDEKNLNIKRLQEQILLEVGGENLDLSDYRQGQQKLSVSLSKQPSFIFIDNVTKNHLEDLLPQQLSLPPESRMLITSRQNDFKVREIVHEEYCMETLSDESAKELLRSTVLKSDHVPCVENELECIDEIAEACGGVPLLLKVYGEHLREDGSESSFCEALSALREGERGVYKEEALSEKLLFVFHKMKDQDTKDAFLDICTFYHGWPCDLVSAIVGENQLKTLQKGALLTINVNNDVIIHDVVHVMGNSEAKGTRLRSREDLKAILEEESVEKLKLIKGIWIDDDPLTTRIQNDESELNIESKKLDAMSDSLRVLTIIGSGIRVDGHCQRKFKNLRYLELGSSFADFPFKDGLTLEKLTYLDVGSTICTKFIEQLRTLQYLKNLKCLRLYGFELTEFPKEFLFPTNMVFMDLLQCEQLQGLPRNIGDLSALKELSIRGCKGLTELPRELGHLVSLRSLDLYKCEQLQSLPPGIGSLTALTELSLERCKGLTELPREFRQLVSLKKLELRECERLQNLPEEIGSLTTLTELSLKGCKGLLELPRGLGMLVSLKNLYLSICICLHGLPEGIGGLTSLTNLSLKWCKGLTELPMELEKLVSLEILELSGCEQLRNLPQGIGSLTALRELSLGWCNGLTELPRELGKLVSLKNLDLYECKQLQSLPQGIGSLTALTYLSLRGCKGLIELPRDLGQLISLRNLDLCECEQLQSLPQGIGSLTALTDLSLRGCTGLAELPRELGQLASLNNLDLHECKQLQSLTQEIGHLTALTKLSLSGCEALTEFPKELGQLISLSSFDIYKCKQLQCLPQEIGNLIAMTDLSLKGCKSLIELPTELGQLISLRKLDLCECEKLQSIPQRIDGLTVLTKLFLGGCKALTKLPEELGKLNSLTHLYLNNCERLMVLPDEFGKLRRLEILSAEGCYKLERVSNDFACLASLMYLNFQRCPMLEASTMEKVVQLKSLKKAYIFGSDNLVEKLKQMDMTGKQYIFEIDSTNQSYF
eukprot:Gb_01595 [translate_table: standard]